MQFGASMLKLDERLDETYLNTVYSGNSAPPGMVFGINLNNDAVYQSLKADIKRLFADYIESIELPKIRRPMYRPNRQLPPYLAGAETLDPEHVKMMKCYNSGYNLATKDCQAKLDEAVKELRK